MIAEAIAETVVSAIAQADDVPSVHNESHSGSGIATTETMNSHYASHLVCQRGCHASQPFEAHHNCYSSLASHLLPERSHLLSRPATIDETFLDSVSKELYLMLKT